MAQPSPSGKLLILLKDKLSCRSDRQLTLGSRVTSGPTQFLETLSALSDGRDSSSTGSVCSWLPCRSSRVRFLRFCIRKVNQKVSVVKQRREAASIYQRCLADWLPGRGWRGTPAGSCGSDPGGAGVPVAAGRSRCPSSRTGSPARCPTGPASGSSPSPWPAAPSSRYS